MRTGLLEPAVAHLPAFDFLNPHGIISWQIEQPGWTGSLSAPAAALPGCAAPTRLRQDRPDAGIPPGAETEENEGNGPLDENSDMLRLFSTPSPWGIWISSGGRPLPALTRVCCVCCQPQRLIKAKNQMFLHRRQKLQLVRTAGERNLAPMWMRELWPGLLADFAVRPMPPPSSGACATPRLDVEYQMALMHPRGISIRELGKRCCCLPARHIISTSAPPWSGDDPLSPSA